jgi:SNF2 family DNA or RNA helicase
MFPIASFRNTFEKTISRSRDTQCSAADKKLGDARSAELARLTQSFVIRRTADLLKKWLPPKVEQVVFCRLTPCQSAIYKCLLRSKAVSAALANADGTLALGCITLLKKVCNHPSLVHKQVTITRLTRSLASVALTITPITLVGYRWLRKQHKKKLWVSV